MSQAAARRELGIPLRRKEVVQPYLVEAGEPEHTLHLRFRQYLHQPAPVLGDPDGEVSPRAHLCPVGQVPCVKGEALGGAPVGNGWYVDRDIRTVSLPDFAPGENLLEIAVPIGPRTNLENFPASTR